jgi:hypothetical protein
VTAPAAHGSAFGPPTARAWRRLVAVVLCGLVSMAALAGWPSAAPATGSTDLRAPLTSSFVSGNRTWLVLPMGRLSQPANTFWQLLERPAGSTDWALVTPPGVADNGGLVVAAGSSPLQAAVLPSQRLRFSPLASTDDGGATWSPGLVPAALVSSPDALAVTARGVLAVVDGGRRLLAEHAGTARWVTALSVGTLARSAAGDACRPQALLAVTPGPDGSVLVAAACRRPGHAGLFELTSRGTQVIALPVPARDPAQVLRLSSSAAGSSALIELDSNGRRRLEVATVASDANRAVSTSFTVSSGLRLDPDQALVATGSWSGGGFFVLLEGRGGAEELAAASTGRWTVLPAPPRGTVAVAFSPGRIDAVTVQSSTLIDDTLALGGAGWRRAQVLRVPIQYGSSD